MDNMIKTDICVIGGGSGGLAFAEKAVQMGASVVIVEKGKMGGDCLFHGCVPSKAILASARIAKYVATSREYGVIDNKVAADYKKIRQHIYESIADIAPHDSKERFESLGVKVIHGFASFKNKKEIRVGEITIRAKRFVVATGSSAKAPPIFGLEGTPYYTNETIFDLEKQPKHLIVIGGGPIGCELSQAHCLLGTPVSLIQRGKILSKDDPELTEVVRDQFIQDGLNLYEDAQIKEVMKTKVGVQVVFEHDGATKKLQGSHLLIAVGRQPNLQGLNLEAAGIQYTPRGITVNTCLRSSNRRVYAIGDIAGGYQFTHIAHYHADIVLKNILFHWPAKVHYHAVPWVTYVEPELGHVGMSETEAREKYKNIRVLKLPFHDNDRAVTERRTSGFIKVIANRKGIILGAEIVGHDADELIGLWAYVISNKLPIKSLTNFIVPYPTRTELSKAIAQLYYKPLIYSSWMKKLVKFLMWF